MAGEQYAFVVAVVGEPNILTDDELYRMLSALVARHRDHMRICLMSAGRHSPRLDWCQAVHWDLQIAAQDSWVKRECELVAWADAVVVLGDPDPWRRLLALCEDARIPARIIRRRPKHLPAAPTFPIDDEDD